MQQELVFEENVILYKHLLEGLRAEKSSRKVRNDSLTHAKILVNNLLIHAKEEVLIYTSSFCGLFYLSDHIQPKFKSEVQFLR